RPAGLPVLNREHNREIDVHDGGNYENYPRNPEQLRHGVQRRGIMVKGVWPEEEYKVAREVNDDETDEDEAGYRHQLFLENRTAEKRSQLRDHALSINFLAAREAYRTGSIAFARRRTKQADS